MFILKILLGAILWSAMGAMVAAYIIIGAAISLLCLIVLASSSGVIMANRKSAKYFRNPVKGGRRSFLRNGMKPA
jgi:hypothetical protein